MKPNEKALREKITRLEGQIARLSTQCDALSEGNEHLMYDRDRYFEQLRCVRDLRDWLLQTGETATGQNIADALEGKSIIHLMMDLSQQVTA